MGFDLYRVMLTQDAEEDLNAFLDYLVRKKRNPDAAIRLIDDFERALVGLAHIAGSLKLDDDPKLARMGYRRIHLDRHNYFMLYRVVDDTAIVDRVFHDRQDYRNHME